MVTYIKHEYKQTPDPVLRVFFSGVSLGEVVEVPLKSIINNTLLNTSVSRALNELLKSTVINDHRLDPNLWNAR